MYETIINITTGQVVYEMEGEILRAVQRCGIDVNKDELVKALQYDREQYDKGYQDGLNADKWIPCSEELPPQPKRNPMFEGRQLELYLVTECSSEYPWRAFWNGKFFTDGFQKVEVIAWMPLPPAYTK